MRFCLLLLCASLASPMAAIAAVTPATKSNKSPATRPVTPAQPAAPVAAAPTAPAPRTLAEAAALKAAGQTNIIAKVDNPMVTNIIAWEERPAVAPKMALEFSALRESLLPTDRDQLQNEIRYTQLLNQPVAAETRNKP